jgi:aspartate/methionine/tyrosine aminotransferase
MSSTASLPGLKMAKRIRIAPFIAMDVLAAASARAADGAFYLYADVAHLTDDSAGWCAALLEATGVALTPGADFDSINGHRLVRLAFAGTHERVTAGADRLARISQTPIAGRAT